MDVIGIWTYFALGAVQGVTELLPVSSSGHLVLAHAWLGATTNDLAFDALLHFATAIAIAGYFWRDIVGIVREGGATLVALLVATIPAGVMGLILEDVMATIFRNPLFVAYALIVGSVCMIGAEWVYRRRTKPFLTTLTVPRAVVVGLFQSLALVPGMSRSGMSIVGGMVMGLSREESARFGFLLGVPLLLGAGAKKTLDMGVVGMSAPVVLGALVAASIAVLVIHYFLRFLRTHTLYPFVAYRVALAVAILLLMP